MAEIKVADEVWSKLSDFDKGKIEGILLAAGSLKAGDKITGDPTIAYDPNASRSLQFNFPGIPNPLKDICLGLCATAAGVAGTACAGITDGIASAACYLAASAAYEECKGHC
ncbi:hypothetical protein PQR71_35335 [Paraburkholderia fungorum]|uniref:hypothetical protein n=1 Tax=Paraburkholderia fungorum TaxID=134537 RepID=UPI0038B851CC